MVGTKAGVKIIPTLLMRKGFLGGSVVKNLPASEGDAGSIPGSGRSPGGGKATLSNLLAWRTPRTEEPGGLQSVGSQRVGHDLSTKQQRQLKRTVRLTEVRGPVQGHPARSREVRRKKSGSLTRRSALEILPSVGGLEILLLLGFGFGAWRQTLE